MQTMEENTEEALRLYFGCYFPRPHIDLSLPKLLNKTMSDDEWLEIHHFLFNKKENYEGCDKFSNRDCNGCAIQNLI